VCVVGEAVEKRRPPLPALEPASGIDLDADRVLWIGIAWEDHGPLGEREPLVLESE
jgi:hypothetical protein